MDAAAELHHFCDGSQVGYGACSYVRTINKDGKIHVALIASKARLAPINQVSVPRLELSGAILVVQLDILLKRELGVPLGDWTFSVISWTLGLRSPPVTALA